MFVNIPWVRIPSFLKIFGSLSRHCWNIAKLVRPSFLVRIFKGSNPFIPRHCSLLLLKSTFISVQFNSLCIDFLLQKVFIVQWSGHRPFTARTRVRIPLEILDNLRVLILFQLITQKINRETRTRRQRKQNGWECQDE